MITSNFSPLSLYLNFLLANSHAIQESVQLRTSLLKLFKPNFEDLLSYFIALIVKPLDEIES